MDKVLVLTLVNGDEHTFYGDEAVMADASLSRCITHSWGNVVLKKGAWNIRVFENHIVSISTNDFEAIERVY